MGNGMWKQEARDSIEEPTERNEKLEDQRPQESSSSIPRHAWVNRVIGFDCGCMIFRSHQL